MAVDKDLPKDLENPGIDPGTSRMLSERSAIWANPPFRYCIEKNKDNSIDSTKLPNCIAIVDYSKITLEENQKTV